ncbi:MAG TPA: low molecular weight protein-tyrosine-phosphatase [Nitrospira sp.]|nr:low molecular weight protein-tyrosine-phosphatase [Nitrospira sp.]
MTASETSTWSQHCWNALRTVKHIVSYVTGPVHIARRLYHQWSTVVPFPITSVLFVCHGNICRSPFAEIYFRSVMAKTGMALRVMSAGLDTTPGKPAHANTKALGRERQLSLDQHTTTQLQSELVSQSDLIVVMEIAQKQRIQSLYPASNGKVVLLGYFDPKGPLEIADPYGKPMEQFQACFAQVARCCDNLAQALCLAREQALQSRPHAAPSKDA